MADRYAAMGGTSIDPVVFFRLQLVMFFENIRSERRLMEIAADCLSIRWYLGTVAMLLASTLPATAAPPANSLIYFPVPNGAGGTSSCSGGPPFVSELGSTEDNCTYYQSGAPPGLVCDTLTTVTYTPTVPEAPELTQFDSYGLLCH